MYILAICIIFGEVNWIFKNDVPNGLLRYEKYFSKYCCHVMGVICMTTKFMILLVKPSFLRKTSRKPDVA
jgi:hypothetical protein